MAASTTIDDTGDSPSWRARFPWLMLVDAFWLAMTPSVLALALLGVVACSCGWWLSDAICLSDDIIQSSSALTLDTTYLGSFPGSRHSGARPLGLDETEWGKHVVDHCGAWPESHLTAVPYRFLLPFIRLVQPLPSLMAGLYYMLGGIWTVAVWAVVGTAITRIGVLHFARGERLGFSRALSFGLSKFVPQMGAALMPAAGVVLMALPLILLGFLLRWSPMVVVAGLIWIFVLPVGFVMAVIAVGWFFGWPLMWGAVSSEDQDAFDAVSRSYSYTFQIPVRYAFYLAIVAFIGIFGWLIVWCVSELVIYLAQWGVSIGAGSMRMAELNDAIRGQPVDSSMIRVGGRLFGFWQSVVRGCASAYASSYFWCALSGIYLLLRHDADATELDEIYSSDESGRYLDLKGLFGRGA